MRFFGEAHELRLYASAFERHEGLLTLLNGAAMVMLVVDDERWRLGFAQIFHRRHIPQLVHALLWRARFCPELEDPIEVARAPHADPIGHTALRHRRFEAIGMPHDPQRHKSAVRAASHAHAFAVDVRLPCHEVSELHQVVVIRSAEITPDRLRMFFAVAPSAARIGEVHHVSVRRKIIELMHEELAILRPRSAVNFKDRRIGFVRVKIGREHDPALQVGAVRAFVPNLFHLGQFHRGKIIAVDVRQIAHRVAAQLTQMDLRRVVHTAVKIRHLLLGFVERDSSECPTFADDFRHILASDVDPPQNRGPVNCHLEIDAFSVVRPHRRNRLR